jgi:hypothetical protein
MPQDKTGSRIDGLEGLPYKPAQITCRSDELRIFMAVAGSDPSGLPRHGATSGELRSEADLSTEQAGAQAPSRVSRAHVDQGRPQGGSGAALARTQAAQRLTAAPPHALLPWND